MTYSYTDVVRLTCPRCKRKFSENVWLIVDIDERPDLVARIGDNTLHTFTCLNCGYDISVPAPLLIYRPLIAPPLLFSPAPNSDSANQQQDAEILVDILRIQNVADWLDEWLTLGLYVVSREHLFATLKKSPEITIDEDQLSVPVEIYEVFDKAVDLSDDYQVTKDPTTLDKAIEARMRIVTHPSFSTAQPIFRLAMLNDVSGDLLQRYQACNDTSDLNLAIDYLQQANALTAAMPAWRAIILNHLGKSLFDRYMQCGDKADIEQSIQILQQATICIAPLSFDRVVAYMNLGSALQSRFMLTSSADDLDQSIRAFQEAVRRSSETPSGHLRSLNNLGTNLMWRYRLRTDPIDLEQAINCYDQALELATTVAERARILSNRGAARRALYTNQGDSAILDQSVHDYRQAMQLLPEYHPDRAAYLDNLGNGLLALYHFSGNVEHLEESLKCLQEAADFVEASQHERSMRLNNLSTALGAQYSRTGDLAALEKAIRVSKKAIELTPVTAPHLSGYFNSLGNALYAHYLATKNPAELEEAIDTHQRAVDFAPLDSVEKASFLNNLGNDWNTRYSLSRDFSHLEQAIDLHLEALRLTPFNTLDRASRLTNMGNDFFDRYYQTGDLGDLKQATRHYEEALTITPATSPTHVVRLNNLASCLREYHSLTGSSADLEKAVELYRQACMQGLADAAEESLRSSRNWGHWALKRAAWSEAIDAFDYGLRAIEQLVQIQTLRVGKQAWLREAQTIFTNAAYAQIRSGEASQAVSILETGRARLLAEILERNRIDLENLPMLGHVDLFQRYQFAAQRIAQLERGELQPETMPAGYDIGTELRGAHDDLHYVTAEIQRVPGYEDFFCAPTFEQVQRALTTEGHVGVYVLVTSVGGLALVVHPGGVKEVWLDLTEDEVDVWLIKRDDQQVTGGYLPAQMGEAPLDAQLDNVLPLLGEKIMWPVAEALKSLSASEVTLIPCGRLSLLPLHAAKYQADGQTQCFMDEFTVTYTPSARAMGSCRDTLSAMPAQSCTLCGVGNPLPLPEGVTPLTYAQPEVEEIASLFGEATTLLYEQQATREALGAQLGRTTYLHLSCHGEFKLQDPLESGVVLNNSEMLTVKDLIGGQQLRGTRLVVLSACQTAITDFNDLPEEAIGLPGGFVQAGVPGVVGTLWPVNDLSTMLLMVKFYAAHLKEGLAPAAALRQAQLWLRDVTNAELSELFARYKLTATDRPSTRMAYEMASEKFREYTLRDPDERPYAHPYYWAPFVFYGT